MIKTNLYTKVALAVLAQALPYAAFAQLAQPDTIYKQTFDDEASFMTMTLVDADKNGKQWDFDQDGYKKGYAQALHNFDFDSDNWLITPDLNLEGGRMYILDYKAYGNGYFPPELISQYMNVAFGRGPKPDAYTVVSTDKKIEPGRTFRNYRLYIKVKESADDYRVGFEDVSYADSYILRLDDIFLTKGCLFEAPDSVSAFTVTAAEKGVAKATISFTAPTLTADGKPLGALNKVSVYRDGTLIKVFMAPAAGIALSFTDTRALDGYNTYQVVATNASGDGIVTARTVYVGVDVPAAPSNVKSTDLGDKMHLEWTAPTKGKNGFYIDPAKLTYNVYAVSGWSNVEQVARNISGTSIDFDNNFTGAQHSAKFRITAQNSAGEGAHADAPELILGTNYTLPFAETFMGGKTQTYWWKDASSYYNFSIVSKEVEPGVPYDGYDDSSYATFYPMEMDEDNCWASYNTGKISLKGTTKPILKFGYRFDVKGILLFKVLVKVPGKDDVEVFSAEREEGANGWHSAKVDLSKYINEPYVILKFWGKGADGNYIDFDNVSISDGDFDTDLAADLTARETAVAGETITVNARVANYGTKTLHSYDVQLLNDGKPVKDVVLAVDGEEQTSQTVTRALKAMSSETIGLTFRLPSDATKATLSVKVTAEGDQNATNDVSAERVITLQPSTLSTATGLKATKGNAQVTLNWMAPDVKNTVVTDDFESYKAFDISAASLNYYNIGLWRMFDGDQSYTQGIPYSKVDETGVSATYMVAYPGNIQEDAFAWMVFAPSQTTPNVEELYTSGQFTPHSGKQYLMAATATDPATASTTSDDWLISPLLSGEAQKLQFYAASPSSWGENFEIYVSTNSNDVEDFVLLNRDVTNTNRDGWKLHEYDLPANTKYFAIRYCSDNLFMMLLDDISYTTGDGTLMGYNVYRDGQLIDNVAATATSYIDATAGDTDHAYTITALYSRGESAHSNVAGTSTGIGTIETANEGATAVYDLEGRQVPTTAQKGVYVVRKASGKTLKIVKK